MTYIPSESEKRFSTMIQALASVFFFLPPLVALNLKSQKRSPYVRYWSKTCLCWSLITMILVTAAVVSARILNTSSPAIILIIVHFVFCVTGALSSYFNTPFCYWFVARSCCESELAAVYGKLVSRAPNSDV